MDEFFKLELEKESAELDRKIRVILERIRHLDPNDNTFNAAQFRTSDEISEALVETKKKMVQELLERLDALGDNYVDQLFRDDPEFMKTLSDHLPKI